MKAAYHESERKITVRNVEMPRPGKGEYLVKIKACAICGSDTWWNSDPYEGESVRGHETAGVIESCGAGADKFSRGERIVCYAILGCGACGYCKAGDPTHCSAKNFIQGGFQEYGVFKEELLFPFPDDFDFTTASLLTDTIGVPLRGLRRLKPEKGDKVCVWGLGPLGLLHVMLLKAAGIKTIIGIDIIDERLDKARELGATNTINPLKESVIESVRAVCGGIGADKAYTYVRHPGAMENIFKSTREGASVCTFVGIEGEHDLPEWYERTLVWSFYFTPSEYGANLKFIIDNNIDLKKIISDVFPLEKINDAFLKRFQYPEKSLKIIVKMY